jgi:hypothetical protein
MSDSRVYRHVTLGEISSPPFLLITAYENKIWLYKRRGDARAILKTIEAELIAKRGAGRMNLLDGNRF